MGVSVAWCGVVVCIVGPTTKWTAVTEQHRPARWVTGHGSFVSRRDQMVNRTSSVVTPADQDYGTGEFCALSLLELVTARPDVLLRLSLWSTQIREGRYFFFGMPG